MSQLLDTLRDRIADVGPRVAAHVTRTPLAGFPAGDDATGGQVLLKCEHLQKTGSFKVRGALAKLLMLTDEQRTQGVIAASSGNHGLGVAYALSVLGGSGIVIVPENASPTKVAAIRRLGVEVRHVGDRSDDCEAFARGYAAQHGLTYVSPYNDLDVVAGQATIGTEITEQLGDHGLDAVVVAVGGGGLISGVAAALTAHRPDVRVIAASPANDAAMAASVAAGRVVDVEGRPTISDGTAGGVEPGAVTLPLCRELVDEWVLVEESEIHSALRTTLEVQHQLVEGAAATAIAATLRLGKRLDGQRVVVVSCGANISLATLRSVL
jgi:threonine dehydratase